MKPELERLRLLLAAAAAFALSLYPLSALGASFAVRSTAHPPIVDAALSDPAWKDASIPGSFTDYQSQSAAPLPTHAYLTADDRNIYVAFVCEQQSPVVVSNNFNDLRAQSVDFVEFDIDPSGNGSRIYRFLATPNHLQTQFSSETSRYYPRWNAQGVIEGNRYVVELVVPFKAMKLGRDVLKNARINVIRHVAAAGADYTWSYDSRVTDLHSDSRYWPVALGLRPSAVALKGDPTADFYLLETGGADRERFALPNGGFETHGARVAGVDVTYPITNTISFVGTAAPDFSNVDVDQTTIAPQRFPFHYTEYRPFFARGRQYVDPLPYGGIAQTNVDLFYTPTLAFLDSGMKVEGTAGNTAFGVLNAKGEGFNDLALGYQDSSQDRSRVLAVQAVAANHPGIADRAGGVSYTLQNQKSGVFANAEYLVDRSPLVDTPSAANASLFALGVHNKAWLAEVGYQSIGPEFFPLDAYVATNDVRGPFAYVAYARPTKGLRQLAFTGSVDRFLNWNGTAGETDALLSLFAQTNSLISLSATTSTTEIATYQAPFPIYGTRDDVVFDQALLSVGFGDGTARSLDLAYSVGPFGIGCGGGAPAVCAGAGPTGYAHVLLRQPSVTLAQQLSSQYTLSLQYAGSIEQSLHGPYTDSQWLRRIGISRALGKRGTFSVSLRSINGRGGYARPGLNFSGLLDLQTANLDHLYAEFGSPSSTRTLNRVLVKYVFHVGGGTGI